MLICTALQDDVAADYVMGRPIVHDINSESVFKHARIWIEECQMKHINCPTPEDPLLPTRVVDVGNEEGTSPIKLRVGTNQERAKYAALSYCWGGSQSVALVKSTLDTMKGGISTHNLPKTLCDAIEVTKKLGLSFLWVDALCILQDDTQDKMKEIQKMGMLYQNATVTIVAATANGVREGFLFPRKSQEAFTFPFLVSDGRFGTVSMAPRIYAYRPVHPVDKRAWTMQEFLLSPRVLNYGEAELTWHCQTEAVKTISKSQLSYYDLFHRLPKEIFTNKSLRQISIRKQQRELWPKIIENYSRRELTVNSDRLLAILGIANVLTEIWNDTYLAGMWLGSMIAHMGWYRDPFIKGTSMRRSDIVPSWSWASLEHPVAFWTVYSPEAEVIDCSIRQLTLRLQTFTGDEVKIQSRLTYMDVGTTQESDHEFCFGLLGRSKRDWPVYLILAPTGNKCFKRMGLGYAAGEEVKVGLMETVKIL